MWHALNAFSLNEAGTTSKLESRLKNRRIRAIVMRLLPEESILSHITLDEALKQRDSLRAAGKMVVFTNGHFDLLHVGHVDYLEKARALGDALFVGLNSDASTTRLKGEGRPIVPEEGRARMLAALKPVTAVIIFEEDTADAMLRSLQPDVYVKGGDYANKPLPERPTVEAYGGRVELIEYLPEHSTSNLIARVRALP